MPLTLAKTELQVSTNHVPTIEQETLLMTKLVILPEQDYFDK